jgi:putative acetyltransferase
VNTNLLIGLWIDIFLAPLHSCRVVRRALTTIAEPFTVACHRDSPRRTLRDDFFEGWRQAIEPLRRDNGAGKVTPMAISIQVDDPLNGDVQALINAHLDFARSQTPLCHVFALPAESLAAEEIVFYSCRDDGVLVGIGALREIGDRHFEIKSMHTAQFARGRGVARTMLDHLIDVAHQRGAKRVSLETGTSSGFHPARSLYAATGFEVCEPFGDYAATPDNVCMTLSLSSEAMGSSSTLQ